jgi:arylsulfatase A-like enzyme
VYDPVAVAWLPSAAVADLVLAVVVRARLRRRSPSPRRLVVGGVAVAVAAAAALVWTGATYGRSNAVRTALERPSITGLRLLRSYATLTDRDGDGHSFAFGGGDCDDSRSDVHPGARDIEGDGIDADCFAGDGSPEVASLSDGAYGEPPEGLSRPNFLLVTVDALRPDHLGCYGYDRPTSPEIDAFAKDAVQFDEVVAQSSRSIRSVPALRTGFYPSQIAYGPEYLWPTLEEENVTVEEVLQRQGYRTAVTMGTDYFERLGHFFQGYDEVQQIDRYRPPRPLPVTKALKQLRRLNAGSQPWFLWVHLFNVHEEYLWDDTPSRFGDDPVDAYDTEIVFADREVGRLLDGLNEAGAASDTVVAIASDHGEAFGEHGNRGHSFTIYEEELRVPLLVRVPGMKPRRVRQPVALFDLMPTILNLARVPVPKPMPARSLVPLMNGTDRFPEERLMFSEILPDGLYPYDQKAIRRGSDKLIWWVREGTFQLYDLEADPGEQNDLSDDQRERADELLGLLRAWVAETNRPELRQTDVLEENRLDKAPRNMTQRLDVDVGDTFTLLGFDLEETSYRPGERIKMDFFYKVRSETDRSLFLYVDVVGPNGYRVPHFHAHHYPLHGRYPTNRWEEGEILRDPVEMVIPKDIRTPVELRITFTALGPDRRPVPLHTEDGERSTVELTTVRVRPEGT